MSGKKQSKTNSMLRLKCPSCGESDLFNNPNTYQLKDLGGMKEYCDHCGVHLRPEPGFYFGAAYVAWGLVVALWISVLVALKVLGAIGVIEFGFLTHPGTFLITGLIANIAVFPYLFRLSRSMWAHFFIKETDAPAKKKDPATT
ncbi:MAG: hypothetical protein RL220_1930 [Bacteroidota bacterium]